MKKTDGHEIIEFRFIPLSLYRTQGLAGTHTLPEPPYWVLGLSLILLHHSPAGWALSHPLLSAYLRLLAGGVSTGMGVRPLPAGKGNRSPPSRG